MLAVQCQSRFIVVELKSEHPGFVQPKAVVILIMGVL